MNDNNFSMNVFSGSERQVEKVDVVHAGFFGAVKVATLSICETHEPDSGIADGATTVVCHDGLWKDSRRAVFSLGGFLPTVGQATLFEGGPVNEMPVAEFNCKRVLD